MGLTLITAGIAFIAAAIVGGGLKAFGVEVPVLKSRSKTIALGGLGVLVLVLGLRYQSTPSEAQSKPPQSSPQPQELQLIIRQSLSGSPSFYLGSGPEAKSRSDGFWFYFDVLIENHCDKPVDIDPIRFQLYVASKPNTSDAELFSPEIGVNFKGKMASGWVEPGKELSGRLAFQVPNRLKDGSDYQAGRWSKYYLIRYPGVSDCKTQYDPY